MKSLRARALTGGIIWATLAILIGVFGMASFLDTQTQTRFDQLLRNRHTQALVAVANNYDSPDSIAQGIGDPVYGKPFSGEYWQVQKADGALFVSKSLVDSLLPQPDGTVAGITLRNYVDQTGEQLRSIAQWLTLDDGSQWHVQVASSVQTLLDERRLQRSNLMLAFGMIAIVGVVGTFFQVTATFKPLNKLRHDVLTRWDSEDGLRPDAYPTEVAPLVKDINTLLERNRDIVSRSRRQAADLAHAIKTPSAIVRNELEQLRHSNFPVAESLAALDRLDAQLNRSFARMRADRGSAGMRTFTDVEESLGRMIRAFKALAANQDKTLTFDVGADLRIRIDQHDFEEVMGNLLDNALKWSGSKIYISATRIGDLIKVCIEDDGPGIPEDDYGTATLSGQRLDTAKPGTGLGLAIAADLAHAYGGKVTLGESAVLGGLQVRVLLPMSGI